MRFRRRTALAQKHSDQADSTTKSLSSMLVKSHSTMGVVNTKLTSYRNYGMQVIMDK